MIITKTEFKDTVKEIIVNGISNTQPENMTEEENTKSDKELTIMLTDYFEKVIRNIFCGENWTYSKDELATVSGSVLNDRFSDKQTFCAVPFFRISDIGKNFLIAKDA